jgi:hypothetical protein
LLHQKIELGLLAKELDDLDANDAAQPNSVKLKTVKLADNADTSRKKILEELELKMGKYCKIERHWKYLNKY